ncbi:MAG: hypothetical protein NT175_06315 [Bacteroidetes bacterium]|nr:hypothetical protein [Bacteroidota bacterium]
MKKLGLDLGSNSIGWAIRTDSLPGNQFEHYGVVVFEKGVGEGKSGEFSYAAERTKNRSLRRLYQVRKYRLWKTLEILIKYGYCPLSMNNLNRWRNYNKELALQGDGGRAYPVTDSAFNKWIELDFNGDGISDYKSPYQLRKELVNIKLDLNISIERYKIGRALHHIAQRRGFKSSRKTGDKENTAVYRGSRESGARGVNEIGEAIKSYKTLGAALAFRESQDERIRNQYTLRRHYEEEVLRIFEVQEIDSSFKQEIIKAIFLQRPLRSQKGLIGKCTLESSKHRCPVSHPLFEEFRALTFINNIKYENPNGDWESLSIEHKQLIYNESFFKPSKPTFSFSEISQLLVKKGLKSFQFNYKPQTTVAGCPVSARLKKIFGDNWNNENFKILRKEIRKSGKTEKTFYNSQDIWHILFSFDDEEILLKFAKEKLNLSDEKAEEFKRIWKNLPNGYAALSLNAINKILPFLRDGMIYSEAVLLANMPQVLGEKLWNDNKQSLKDSINSLIVKNRKEKQVLNIVNSLISQYKAFTYEERQGWKDSHYILTEDDKHTVVQTIKETFGIKYWEKVDISEKSKTIELVTELYQKFFSSGFDVSIINDKKYLVVNIETSIYLMDADNRFYRIPSLLDTIRQFLSDYFEIPEGKLNLLYHPSQIEIYPPVKRSDEDYKLYLGSPKTGAFKNPMAMRTLHELRKMINYLIKTGKIDEDTQVTVELARDLNDSNQRWAIKSYQKNREDENQEFAKAILELQKEKYPGINPGNPDDIDKFRLWYEQLPDHEEVIKQVKALKDDIQKYRLWKEQGCQCIYTGRIIHLSDLFDENVVDFEHTIPRSISFDNSLANLTVCYASYNRDIKKKRIPTELENYEHDAFGYTPIKPRLDAWQKKVNELFTQVESWKTKSRSAPDKKSKDDYIRKKHLRQYELDYWMNKLSRFTMTEITSGFKNSQLVDTRIISKYAFHYLKTVFNNVEVQKGSVTADFRKIFGIQEKEEKKSRAKHSHHAIDAAVLTLIPSFAKRDSILKKSFELEETTHKQFHDVPYPSFNINHIKQIEDNILVSHVKKDQALTPGKKIIRKRGRIEYLRDKNGKLLLDTNGKKQPKIAQGDCIRGQLHLDTFYGKIKAVQRDSVGKPLKDENNNWIYEEKNDGFKFVIRKQVSLINNLDEIVDPELRKIIEIQLNGRSLKAAFAEGVYMLNREGNPVGNKIRHIRCWAKVAEPLQIKKQTYNSKKEYKNSYWAANSTNYLYALYKDETGEKGFRPLNLFQATEILKTNQITRKEDFFEPAIILSKSKTIARLYAVLAVGQKVLFYQNNRSELYELSKSELSKRLYYLKNLFDANTGTLQFQYHLEARSDQQLSEAFPKERYGQRGKYGFSNISFDSPWPRLLLSPVSLNFLIEDKDFKILPDSEIVFTRNNLL